jgi:flagellar basal-body rod protein FlgG
MSGLSDTVISASGLNTYGNAINVISNNLANSNTTGFKSSRTLFGNELSSAMGVPSLQQNPSGVTVQAVQPLFTQGSLENTSNPLDFAINGNGFFIVKNENNGTISYTRDGEFSLDKSGNLVNPVGLIVQGSSGNITIPVDTNGNMPTSLQLTPNGQLNATYPGGQVKTVGQLELAVFNAPTQLANKGNNLYAQTDGSGAPKLLTPSSGGSGAVIGDTLEESNVNESNEFVNLISIQSAYQSNATALSATNEMFTDMFTLLGTGS